MGDEFFLTTPSDCTWVVIPSHALPLQVGGRSLPLEVRENSNHVLQLSAGWVCGLRRAVQWGRASEEQELPLQAENGDMWTQRRRN